LINPDWQDAALIYKDSEGNKQEQYFYATANNQKQTTIILGIIKSMIIFYKIEGKNKRYSNTINYKNYNNLSIK